MFRRTAAHTNVFDPLFMRKIKRTFERYNDAMSHKAKSAVSREAFVDIDEQGPAWFLGHMSSAVRVIEDKMQDFDFVLDIRDARLPFTTENPNLSRIAGDKPRLIVFNKADLANEQTNLAVQQYYEDHGAYALFTSAHKTWKDTVETLQKFVQFVLPQKQYKMTAHVGCCVGMPNVGKSTLINALRMAHEYQFQREDMRRSRSGETTSVHPGTTRGVKLVPVCRDPNVVLYDTPGLTLAGCFHREAGLKLAACGIIPTNEMTLTDGIVARYLYDVLVASGAAEHLAECLHLPRAPVSFDDCVLMITERSGRSGQTQMGNAHNAMAHKFLLHDFQSGRLGRVTLDKIPKHVVRSNAESDASRLLGSGAAEELPGAGAAGKQAGQQRAGLDPREFMFTHDVTTRDVVRHYPEHMTDVMGRLNQKHVTGAVAKSGAAAAQPQRVRDGRDAGVISRRKGPISAETAGSVGASARLRQTAADGGAAGARKQKPVVTRNPRRGQPSRR
jgi:ribosome biogenesis GTPase A